MKDLKAFLEYLSLWYGFWRFRIFGVDIYINATLSNGVVALGSSRVNLTGRNKYLHVLTSASDLYPGNIFIL